MLDQRRRDVVLRAQRIGGAEPDIGPAGLEASSCRLAVSVVTCRQAVTRMPLNGCSRLKRFSISRSTGMVASAHSIFSFPWSANLDIFHVVVH